MLDHHSQLQVVVVQDFDALAKHVTAWQSLAEQALEPNPFFEPWMLIPAWQAFGRSRQLSFVFVYRASPNGTPRLCGFFPLERRRFKKLRVLGLWQHVHCFLCTPLLLPEEAQACLGALLKWARKDRAGASLLQFNGITGDGPFYRILSEFLREHGSPTFLEDCHTRALWLPRTDADAYIQVALSSGGRQDFRRKRKRLAELGRLEVKVLEHAAEVAQWTQQFMDLEQSGWKGSAGTALAANPVEREYFEEIVRAGFERGQLQMLGLFLDGKPIALKCNFLAGAGAFVFKPAYDEALARYSPGALLELDNMQLCHRTQPVRWMDSCAAPDQPMWNRLWMERRTMQTILISSGSTWGNLLVSALPNLKRLSKIIKGVVFSRPSPLAPRP